MEFYIEEALSPKGNLRNKDLVQIILVLCTILLGSKSVFNAISKSKETQFDQMETFPGPRRFPLVGNAPQLIGLLKSPTTTILPRFKGFCQTYGKLYRLWLLQEPYLLVNCANTAAYLLNRDLIPAKAKEANHAGKILWADGVLSIEPEMHATRRKIWNPSFTRKRIENAMVTFRLEARKLCKELEQYCTEDGGEPIAFDFYKHSLTCAFRIICREGFGKEYMRKIPESRGQEHSRALHTIEKNLFSRCVYPWLGNDFFYLNFTRSGREIKKCVQFGNKITHDAIQERKKLRMKAKTNDNCNNGNEGAKTSDCFLDHLLDRMDEGALSETEVLHELNTFIVAGYETSGMAICYVLYLLSLHPEYQDLVVEELYEIVGRNNFETFDPSSYEVTAGDVKDMKFMELCVKEALRLYPIIPLLLRQTTSDVKLWDGKVIPRGVNVLINAIEIQNDPELFPEPHKFLPERHLHPNLGWIPFSLGSRNCVGQVFGMHEIKVVLAYLLLSYKFETAEKAGFQPVYQVVYLPKDGMRFKITKRTK